MFPARARLRRAPALLLSCSSATAPSTPLPPRRPVPQRADACPDCRIASSQPHGSRPVIDCQLGWRCVWGSWRVRRRVASRLARLRLCPSARACAGTEVGGYCTARSTSPHRERIKPPRKYLVPSEPRSQARLGWISTEVGDHSGTSSVRLPFGRGSSRGRGMPYPAAGSRGPGKGRGTRRRPPGETLLAPHGTDPRRRPPGPREPPVLLASITFVSM